jgi:hypothetical protein
LFNQYGSKLTYFGEIFPELAQILPTPKIQVSILENYKPLASTIKVFFPRVHWLGSDPRYFSIKSYKFLANQRHVSSDGWLKLKGRRLEGDRSQKLRIK